MTEPEAELQATANLSPVSPSPVYTAAPHVVPALQDTVDTIDAMVAAATTVAAPNGVVDEPVLDPALIADSAPGGDDNDDVVDDDSFDDAYGDDNEMAVGEAFQAPPEPSDSNDDYARTFDSPIDPQEGDGQDIQQLVSKPMQPESNQVSLPSDHLTTNGPSDAPPDVVAHDPSAAFAGAPTAPEDHSAAPSGAQPDLSTSSTEASQQPPEPQQHPGLASSVASSEPTDKPDSTNPESQDPSLDIQQLVADLTAPAQPTELSSDPDPSGTSMAEPHDGSTSLTPSTALPSSSSLPPRPPLPHSASQPYASQHHPTGPSSNASASSGGVLPPTPGQSSAYGAVGAPGTSTDAMSSLPPLPTISALNATPYQAQTVPSRSTEGPHDAEYQRHWDQFMADERQYMSEAKWDRFPEGSRIFIGNLSSDKVSKRDVFDVFHKFGRLAQISLKSAYGFVQYHTVDEGQMAMENLQGVEIKGRRIHLEISRVQDKSKKERARSPDRGRGRDGGRRNDKHQGRDDYRPGRNHSPRRNDFNSRDEGFGRDRGFHDSGRGGRGRSRSPAYGRNDRDSYRRRSPSPYGRSRQEPELDLPRRYGADVPDVQIILQPEVSRDFVTWVEGAFKAKALKTEVMFLHPRFPKDQVIQRQAAEGVHGVVDLDLRAQSLGRIPVQAFDRSAGTNNVRFDQYVDLDPGTAAEVILRAKASGPAASYGQGYAAAGGYSNPYGGQHQQVPPHGASYPGVQHPGQYPPLQQQHAPPAAADIAGLMGQVDNATLQRLLSSIQGPPQAQGAISGATGVYGAPASGVNPQVDLQAILGSLGASAPVQQHAPPQGQYGTAYGAQQPAAPNGAANGGGDAAAQVQNIMAQLARYRQ